MAIKRKQGGYECSYCHRIYTDPTKADVCRDDHELVYVQIAREDLMRILQFIHLKNEELITPRIIETLNRYAKLKTAKEIEDLSNM